MAANDVISSFINIPQVQSEIDQVSQGLQSIRDLIISMPKMAADYKANSSLVDSKQATDELTAATIKLNASQKDLNAEIEKSRILSKQKAEEEKNSLESLVAARLNLQRALKSYQIDEQENLNLMKRGILSRQEYNQRVIETTSVIEKNKSKIADLSAQIRANTKDQVVSKTAYKALSDQYNVAANTAKNFAVSLGLTHPQTVAAAKHAKELSAQLKAVDASVGQNQRNVGNYTGALDELGKGFKRVFERILEYASIYAIIDFFKSTVTSALDAEKSVARFKATLENLGREDAFERLVSKAEAFTDHFKYLNKHEVIGVFEQLITYGKLTENQITNLLPVIINYAAKQRKTIEEATTTVIKALEGQGRGLKELGINIKDTHSVTERLGIVMTDLAKRVDGAADAFANATSGSIASSKEEFVKLKEEIGTGLLPMINELLKGLNGLMNGFKRMAEDGLGTVLSRFAQGISNFKNSNSWAEFMYMQEQMKKSADVVGKGQEGKQVTGSHIVFTNPGDTNPAGNKILGAGGNLNDKTHTKKPHVDSENLADEYRKKDLEAIRKASIEELNILKDKYRIEADDQNNSFTKRYAAQVLYNAANITSLEKNKQSAIEELDLELKTADKKANKIHDATKREEALTAITKYGADKRKEIESTYSLKAEQDLTDDLNKRVTISGQKTAQLLKIEQDRVNVILNQIDEGEAMQEKQADKDYADGKIKRAEDLAKKLEDIQDNAAIQKLKTQIKSDKDSLDSLVLTNAQRTEIEAKIAKEENDLEALQDKKKADNKAKLESVLVKIKEDAQKLIIAIVQGSYERELNHIQDQIDMNTKLKDAQIERINSSTLSEQDKAAKITQINATAQAKQDELDKKKRETQTKQAKFDRDVAILQILGNVAAAEYKIISEGGPGFIPVAVGLGIDAALQIGALLAKPLPKFEKGTMSSPEGLALTDERGPEGYITPSGKAFIGNDQPTLRYLERGTKIIPHDEIQKMMMTSALKTAGVPMESIYNSQKIEQAIMMASENTVKAINKQKHRTVNHIKVDTAWGEYIQKYVKS